MTVGVTVSARTAMVPQNVPILTDTAFLTFKMATTGDATKAYDCRSLADFVAAYGVRTVTNQAAYDWVETFFNEGGQRVVTAQYLTTHSIGMALLIADFGPGQFANIGETPGAVLSAAMIADCVLKNRVAILDVAVTDVTTALLTTFAGTLTGLANSDYCAAFGPWVNVPPPSGIAGGSARVVPASAVICALCARVEAGGNPNRAAAGRDYPLQYTTGFSYSVSKVDRETLLNLGLNTFSTVYGVLENYGFQTPVVTDPNNPYWQFNVSRTRMWIMARAQAIGENYVFKTIDGKGLIAKALEGDLTAMLADLYAVNGLYGLTPQAAYLVNVSSAINTINSIAQGQLHAVMEVKPSLHAKSIILELVTVPLTGTVN
jgi:hypothetical protein